LAQPLKAEGPREGFLRARLWVGEDATVGADASLDQDSSLTSVLAAANGCVRRAADAPAAEPGEIVEAFLFEGRSL
jgi:molybdopterin molybdotransferase